MKSNEIHKSYSVHTNTQTFGVSKMFLFQETSTLIQQGHIKLIKKRHL